MSAADERPEKDGGQRGRPGRRCGAERHNAILEVLQGKATVDQVAWRMGVRPEAVAGWKEDGPAAMLANFQRGDGPTLRERELEAENGTLRDALTRSAMQVELLQRELGIPDRHPSQRGSRATAGPAMSPSTSPGDAPVALLADTFGLSRQAIYAARAPTKTAEAPAAAVAAEGATLAAEGTTIPRGGGPEEALAPSRPGRGVPATVLREAISAGPLAARSARGCMSWPQRPGRFPSHATGTTHHFAPGLVS
jgi:transposase-like protein